MSKLLSAPGRPDRPHERNLLTAPGHIDMTHERPELHTLLVILMMSRSPLQ